MKRKLDRRHFASLEEHIGHPLTEEEIEEAARFLRQFEHHQVDPRAREAHRHVTRRRLPRLRSR